MSIGIANCAIFIFTPKLDTIHAVVVVPMFEPKIIPIAPLKLISSALKKEMTIIDIKEELCTIAVAKKPVPIALGREFVLFLNTFSSIPPLNNLNPSSIKTIPIKKTAIPAIIILASLLKNKIYATDKRNNG